MFRCLVQRTLGAFRATQLQRPFSFNSYSLHEKWNVTESNADLHMTFVQKDGSRKRVPAQVGMTVLDVAHAHDVDLEGACEASLACSTCHVVVSPQWFPKVSKTSEEEDDMLDLAFGLTQTSRLGCQIVLTKDLDGLEVTLPAATRNMQVDKKK